ncbi:MAG TPA: hypothetical protein VGY55_13340 [Pirellulales bacterium]|jgi:hypothetical protein|nr:hypothetical protein [Pirellulales bacterium]
MAKATKSPARGPERKPPPARKVRSDAEVDAPVQSATRGFDWGNVLCSRWLVAAIVISVLIEGSIVYFLRNRTSNEMTPVAGELAVGTFEFSRSVGRENRVLRGQFDLYVRLSEDLTAAEQRQFLQAERQLQQGVEETLRRLRSADFIDPHLTRLKDRVLHRLNDELGFDGIAEVLVANFKIDTRQQAVISAASHDAEPAPGADAR